MEPVHQGVIGGLTGPGRLRQEVSSNIRTLLERTGEVTKRSWVSSQTSRWTMFPRLAVVGVSETWLPLVRDLSASPQLRDWMFWPNTGSA